VCAKRQKTRVSTRLREQPQHTGQATLPVEREKEQQQCVLVQEGKENLERDNGVVSIRGCGNLTGRLEAITGY